MSTKRTQIAIDSNIIEQLKKTQGDFFSMGRFIKSLLDAVINGELQYSNGHWMSVFMRTEIKTPKLEDINNEPVEQYVKTELEKKQESAMPSWADCEKYYRDADNIYRYLKDTDTDIISDLKSIFQKPIEEADEKKFDKSVCEKFFMAIYGLDWKWGDDYNKEPDIYEDSLYNYFKWNERKNVVDRFDSIRKQAIGLIKDAGIDY